MTTPIPPKNLRKCGSPFNRDDYFVGSAIIDAERLRWSYGLTPNSAILDIGCGPGRTLIGLVESGLPFSSYLGVDVQPATIAWAKSNLRQHGKFQLLDVKNARYRPGGKPLGPASRLPLPDTTFDIVVCASLFTHMYMADTRVYLHEIARVLKPGGRVFLTAFVRTEPGIPDTEENPHGYPTGLTKDGGAMHRICYRDDVLRKMIDSAGLTIYRWHHEAVWNMQTEVGLLKEDGR